MQRRRRRNFNRRNININRYSPHSNKQVLIRNIDDVWDPTKETIIINDLNNDYIKYLFFKNIEENLISDCIYLTENIFLIGDANDETLEFLENHNCLKEIIHVNKNDII